MSNVDEYTDAEIRVMWEALFSQGEYNRRLTELAAKFPDVRSMYVDFPDIGEVNPDFPELFLSSPDRCLEVGKKFIRDYSDVFSDLDMRVNLRVRNLPFDAKIGIRDIRASHLGHLVAVDGLVRKATVVNPKAVNACFTCAKCGQEIWVPQKGTILSRPMMCTNPQTSCNKGANTFILDEIKTRYIDNQFLEIQESPDKLRGGQQPERKYCYVDDDLCGIVTTGSRVTVNGIVRSVEKKDNDKTTIFETYLEVVSVDFEDDTYEDIDITPEDEAAILERSRDPLLFEHFVQSIAPTIYGLEEIKQSIVLQLFGGVHKINDDGSEIRGDIHILVVGDPGCAKSQILRYMVNLAPRSIFTSGKSASGAGLTAAVTKDEFNDGRWSLEAGALVLADGGFACIDEIDKMDEKDTSSLHEAMESQKISFAKAGITAVLRTRCSVLAAGNPEGGGRFRRDMPLAQQITLPAALKSRFDLIFALTDNVDEKNDLKLARSVLRVHQRGEVNLNGGREAKIEGVDVQALMDETQHFVPPMSPDFIKKYVAYSKRYSPLITDEVLDMIAEKYVEIRKDSKDSALPITARQLEGYVRLAEASARMRFSNKVEQIDADRAIHLVTYYLTKMADDGKGGFDYALVSGVSTNEKRNNEFNESVIVRIIKEAGSSGATTEDIVKRAEGEGISEEEVKKILKHMTNSAQLYCPHSDLYKVA